MSKIKLNDVVGIDLGTLIESRLLVQANSGGGKSWANRRIIEQAFGKVQIIVLDPEGEFGNMRGEYDFVYVGRDGDAPAESRSAALLARRLLETKASAIVDIYELTMPERRKFVRIFLEAMVNAPKELWHDCLVILDEAHKFAPEKEESEALEAVSDMASRGRKRGFCLIPATQRPAKLNKDVAAECNNKLIGRASLDIDRKRSADELGFNTKDEMLSLRNLEPGDFYAFGPAISRDVIKTKIGDVKVKPPKRGQLRNKPPAPTEKVRKLLASFKDLPAEAQHQIQTENELRTEITALKRQIATKPEPPKIDVEILRRETDKLLLKAKAEIEKAFDDELRRFKSKVIGMKQPIMKAHDLVGGLVKTISDISSETPTVNIQKPDISLRSLEASVGVRPASAPAKTPADVTRHKDTVSHVAVLPTDATGKMGAGEKAVLVAVAAVPDGMTRQHITVHTGYKRSTRDAYILRLAQKGYVTVGEKIRATEIGIGALGSDYEPLPTGSALIEHVKSRLPEGERKILEMLIERGQNVYRDEISERYPEYQRSTRDAYLLRLAARELVEFPAAGIVKTADILSNS